MEHELIFFFVVRLPKITLPKYYGRDTEHLQQLSVNLETENGKVT
jgi:hypothetical protein